MGYEKSGGGWEHSNRRPWTSTLPSSFPPLIAFSIYRMFREYLRKKIDSDIGDITSPACLQSKRSKKEYRDMSDKQINKYLIINISSASFFCSTFCRESCMPHFGTDEKKIIDLPVSPCFPILNIGHPLTSIVFLFLHSTFTKLCIRLLLD